MADYAMRARGAVGEQPFDAVMSAPAWAEPSVAAA